MTSPIYKTFYGKYIDLDRLLIVSEAYFRNKSMQCNYAVSFSMTFQLLENPIIYSRDLTADEITIRAEGSRRSIATVHVDENGVKLCEKKLNEQIQEIIDAWNNWKKYRSPLGKHNFSFTS